MASNPDNTKVALRYAEGGIPVVPLHSRQDGRCACGNSDCERAGMHSCTKNGVDDVTTDPKKIRRLWKERPNAKVGIALGSAANLIALEVRGKKGQQQLSKLESRNRSLPNTVIVRYYSRKFHLFRTDNPPTHTEIADQVRLLSDGDLVPMPRSGNAGKKHAFEGGRSYEDNEVAEAPHWVIASGFRVSLEQSPIDSRLSAKPAIESTEPADSIGRIVTDQTRADLRQFESLMPADVEIPFHPLTTIFPPLDDAQRRALEQDIGVHGQDDSIVLYEGKILDGRAVYLACRSVGVTAKFAEYTGSDPLGYLLRRNALRRHLNESQRAMVAARVSNGKVGDNQYSEGLPIGRGAAMLNVSERSIARAKEILAGGVPELIGAVETGKLRVSVAAEISRVEPDQQVEALRTALLSPEEAKPEADGQQPKPQRASAGVKTAIKSSAGKAGAQGEQATEAEAKGRQHTSAGTKNLKAVAKEPSTDAQIQQLKAELAETTARLRQVEQELQHARADVVVADASTLVPADGSIPPALERRPLTPEEQRAYDEIKAAIERAPPIVQARLRGLLLTLT